MLIKESLSNSVYFVSVITEFSKTSSIHYYLALATVFLFPRENLNYTKKAEMPTTNRLDLLP